MNQTWKLPLILFLFLVSFLSLFSSGVLESEDGWLYSSVARNLYYKHQVTSAPYEYPDKNVHMNTYIGSDGRWRAPGSLGYSIALIPAIASSDLVHRFYGATPPEHFPLESDWSFHLFASMTNAWLGALLGIILFLYARALKFSEREALAVSILTIFTTNLFPLTRFSFPHMLFTTFLVGTFYGLKRFAQTQNLRFLILSAACYAGVFISYNITYLVPLPALFLYLLLLETPRQRKITIAASAVAGVLIFVAFFKRLLGFLSTIQVPLKPLLEGLNGYLFSPGKNMFLYSPPLIILPMFWHKLEKEYRSEILSFLMLTATYFVFVGSAFLPKGLEKYPIWHGGMVWGPRYISSTIPFLMLLVFIIVRNLTKWQRKFIILPIFLVGFLAQLPGATVPYLLQYRDVPYNIFVGQTELTYYDYASFIPRYSPFYNLSKEFVRKITSFPTTINRGPFDVRFFDGFDIPYYNGGGILRGFREVGYISVVNSPSHPLRTIEFTFYNAPDNNSATEAAALVTLSHNGNEQTVTVLAINEATLAAQVEEKSQRLVFTLTTQYEQVPLVPHVLYIKEMKINGKAVNLGSLDYPDVSSLGSKTTPFPYHYYGKVITDRWKLWDLRARIQEQTFDLWWVKNLYYWDRPQLFIWSLFGVNIIVCAFSALKLARYRK